MTDDESGGQQPGTSKDLEAIATELIGAHVERIFNELDPLQLVEDAGLDLSDEEKAVVADLIDSAGVELEIDFSDEDEDEDEDEHDHEHDHEH